jgi:hypothetical protein
MKTTKAPTASWQIHFSCIEPFQPHSSEACLPTKKWGRKLLIYLPVFLSCEIPVLFVLLLNFSQIQALVIEK